VSTLPHGAIIDAPVRCRAGDSGHHDQLFRPTNIADRYLRYLTQRSDFDQPFAYPQTAFLIPYAALSAIGGHLLDFLIL
jgi:hypothetical protein